MRRTRISGVLAALLVIAVSASATSFVMPTDEELIHKSTAIVIGVAEGSHVEERTGFIHTVYDVRVESSLKGPIGAGDRIAVDTPGGQLGDRGILVPGAARFEQGQRVLLFLHREAAAWNVTDMMLGKFGFVTSTRGDRLLVRDLEDVVKWDQAGKPHQEHIRREAGFLRFIADVVHGRSSRAGYLVDASEVTVSPEASLFPVQTDAVYSPETYTDWVSGRPTRWSNISAGLTFYKRSDQNIAGAADGGVSVIQNGLAAWSDECGSNINLIYGGQRATASANFDGISIVEFNDPQGRISGSWTGSGTIAIAFISFSGTHSFGGTTYLSISDADVVFQNGYTATNPAFATAMTHELGHGIGWRHSNQDYASGGACNSSVEECTTSAIMNSSVNTNYGYSLQPWDVHAAQGVYPGGTCSSCTPPAITTQPQSTSMNAGGTATLFVTASGTPPLSYQWYAGASGNTSNPIPGATSSSVVVSPASTTSYWVRVSNACGSANSATATVTVMSLPPPPGAVKDRTDFDGDGRADIFWRHVANGRDALWYMNGVTVVAGSEKPQIPLEWTPVAFGDFDGDGKSDVFWRDDRTAANALWLFPTRTSMTALHAASMGLQWSVQVSGDFNGDGRTDLLWRNQSTGQNIVWYMNREVQAASALPNMSTAFQAVAAGDFDGDGRADLFWRDRSTGANYIWFMTANGAQQASPGPVDARWTVEGTGDFDGDGRADMLWRLASTGANHIWLMKRLPSQTIAIASVPAGWHVGILGDFNGDGVQDIAWRGDNGYNFVMFMRNGQIASQSALPVLNEAGWQMFGLK